jgi:hypothetical protein
MFYYNIYSCLSASAIAENNTGDLDEVETEATRQGKVDDDGSTWKDTEKYT